MERHFFLTLFARFVASAWQQNYLQWRKTGNHTSMIVKVNPSLMLAGELHKSINSGADWKPIRANPPGRISILLPRPLTLNCMNPWKCAHISVCRLHYILQTPDEYHMIRFRLHRNYLNSIQP